MHPLKESRMFVARANSRRPPQTAGCSVRSFVKVGLVGPGDLSRYGCHFMLTFFFSLTNPIATFTFTRTGTSFVGIAFIGEALMLRRYAGFV